MTTSSSPRVSIDSTELSTWHCFARFARTQMDDIAVDTDLDESYHLYVCQICHTDLRSDVNRATGGVVQWMMITFFIFANATAMVPVSVIHLCREGRERECYGAQDSCDRESERERERKRTNPNYF